MISAQTSKQNSVTDDKTNQLIICKTLPINLSIVSSH